MFQKTLPKRLCLHLLIPEAWAWAWRERGTQIVLVELLAPLIALYTWQPFVFGTTIIFFNDRFGVDRDHLHVAHETTVLEHRASALEVALLNRDRMSTDAARRLWHVQV